MGTITADDMERAYNNGLKKGAEEVAALKLQVGDLQKALWDIVTAFKRGITPSQGHKACLCDKCTGIYDAIRAVRVYDSPGLPNQIATTEKRKCDHDWDTIKSHTEHPEIARCAKCGDTR